MPAYSLAVQIRIPETVRQDINATALFRNVPGAQERPRWQRIINALHAMLSYRDDWDGLGSPAPDRDIVVGAIALMNRLMIQPDCPAPTRTAATPSGTVGVEWQSPTLYMEAEITEPGRSEWMAVPAGGPPIHWVITSKQG